MGNILAGKHKNVFGSGRFVAFVWRSIKTASIGRETHGAEN